jgi:hypothetical protein
LGERGDTNPQGLPVAALDGTDLDVDPVDGAQIRRCDDLLRRAEVCKPAVVEDGHTMGAKKSLIRVVGR